MEVQGKTAIVMGGGSGIGRATALALASHGAAVAVGDLEAERVEGVVQEIQETGQQALGSVVDVTQRKQVKEMVRLTLEAFERIDILVNSAGIFPQATVQDMAEEEWDQVIAVNLKGTFLPCKAVLDHMIENQRGRIINISAGHAMRGCPRGARYCASKAAVNALTKTLALLFFTHSRLRTAWKRMAPIPVSDDPVNLSRQPLMVLAVMPVCVLGVYLRDLRSKRWTQSATLVAALSLLSPALMNNCMAAAASPWNLSISGARAARPSVCRRMNNGFGAAPF